ncbi:MAG: hypothetical protein J0L78_01505 [Planctomycetes bacterium]|nr:hypothetical protein [Planctomycetota bacterium]
MSCCDMNGAKRYGSVPLGITLLLTAAVAAITVGVLYLIPGAAAGMNLFLIPFPALMTFGILRATLPKRLRPAWVLLGFPLLIGVSLFTGAVLREAFPSAGGGGTSGGSTMIWLFPVLFAGMATRKKSCECKGRIALAIGLVLGALLLIPLGIAAWSVWEALQAGQGKLFSALPGLMQFAAIWTGLMTLAGIAMAATMGLRRRPQNDDAPAELAA